MEERADYGTTAAGMRAAALSAHDIGKEVVEIPEWGADWRVEVRALTMRQRAGIYRDCADEKGNVDPAILYPAVAVKAAFVAGTGERVFQDADMDGLADKGSAPVSRIAECSLRLSGIIGEAALKKDLRAAV